MLLLFACAVLGLRVLWLAGSEQLQTARAQQQPFVPGEVIVGYNENTTDLEKDVIRRLVNAQLKTRIEGLDADVFKVPDGMVYVTIEALELMPHVRYAEPNYIGTLD